MPVPSLLPLVGLKEIGKVHLLVATANLVSTI
jgi:hypothetical protein